MKIQARAHRRAVDSVAVLLAAATLDQVIGELFRNSRRAGATRIDITTMLPAPGNLRVTDNGRGIEDLDVLLHLGATGWCGQVEEKEEPDGIGFFTLASVCGPERPVQVASRPPANRGTSERRAALYPDTFRGHAPAEVARKNKGWLNGSGTAVQMTLEQPPNRGWLENAALYSPLPVKLDGHAVDRIEYAAQHAPDRVLKWRHSTVAIHAHGRFGEPSGACLDGRVYHLPTRTGTDERMVRINIDPEDGLRPKSPVSDLLAPGEALDDLERFLASEAGVVLI